VEDVKKTVPWDVKVAANVAQTPRPTEDEIDYIRNFAPNIAIGREPLRELTLRT
jgi:hypothetical protein